MNAAQNFSEWTREQKEEFAKQRMIEMREKNQKMMLRHAEVEQDRRNAEEKNSAVTSTSKSIPKKEKAIISDTSKPETRNEHAREWDRGKPDKEHWRSPEHHTSYKSYRSDRYERNGYRWKGHSSSRNEGSDHYRHEHGTDSTRRQRGGSYNYKQHDTDQHYTSSNSSHMYKSPKRSRGMSYRSSESYRKSQSSYSDDRYKKSSYNRSNSRKKYSERPKSSSISSDSENVTTLRISSIRDSLWESDKMKEDENKKDRLENWVKSTINTAWRKKNSTASEPSSQTYSCALPPALDTVSSPPPPEQKSSVKPYSKFDRFERSDHSSSNEDESSYNTPCKKSTPQESSNYSPHKNEFNDKFNIRGGTPHKPQNDVPRKGFKNKRSPQYGSVGSGKNEKYGKQRRFDTKDTKSSNNKEKFVKSKVVKPGSWNELEINKSKDNKYKSSYANSHDDGWGQVDDGQRQVDDGWGQADDGWGQANDGKSKSNKYVSNTTICDEDYWEQPDDGLWGNAEQSDIKWKLNDDDSDVHENRNQNVKFDGWQTKNATNTKTVKDQNKTDDGWDNQNLINAANNRSKVTDCWDDNITSYDVKKNKNVTDDGRKDEFSREENKEVLNKTNAEKEKNFKADAEVSNVKNADSASVSKVEVTGFKEDFHAPKQKSSRHEINSKNSAEKIISPFKHSVRISDEYNIKLKSDAVSEKFEESGWSTVSEEGEIHSDDEKVCAVNAEKGSDVK